MTPTLQMPYREQAAEEIGPRTFRKQILRTGTIPYKGKHLTFTADDFREAIDSFNAKAMDQVPFVLADDENQHPEAPTDRNPNGPERYRGEVKSLELTADGIDAIVEVTDEGADLIRKNPKLGVSARLVPDVERDGKVFPLVIEHVCGTLNPRVAGMKPWESVALSVHWGSHNGNRDQVVDLSTSEYMADSPTLTDDHLEALKGLEGDARVAKARELLGEMKVDDTKDDKKVEKDDGKKFSLKGLLGIKDDKVTDEDIADAIAEAEKEGADEKEPVASLSTDDRKAIDLAQSEARDARAEVAEAKWETERTKLAAKGVPPAMLDLAEPILKTGQKVTIDLSNDEKADASEVIRKLLTAAKGTVDLSKETGSDEDTEDDAQRRKDAEAAAKDYV